MQTNQSKNTVRLEPPETLSAGAARVFRATVATVTADHFREVDMPLLEQFSVAADLARQAQAHLDAEGAIIGGKANAWLVVQEKQVRALTALSARLRLCPQSRFDRLAAATKARDDGLFDGDDPDGLLAGHDDPQWNPRKFIDAPVQASRKRKLVEPQQ